MNELSAADAVTDLAMVAEARMISGHEAAAKLAKELGLALPPEDEPLVCKRLRSV